MNEALFNAVTAGNLAAVEGIIAGLNEAQLVAAMNERNAQGQTLLHVAVANNRLEIVRGFLHLNTNMNVLATDGNNKTPLQLAIDLGHQNIRAALQLPHEIAVQFQGQGGLNFNRVIALTHDCVEAVGDAVGAPVASLVGTTGSGKSTLANYVGPQCNYQPSIADDGEQELAHINGNTHPEVARRGNLPTSQTLHPQIVHLPNRQIKLCDLGGFGDNRGPEERISVANSLQILQNRTQQNYQGLFFVVSRVQLNLREAGFINQYGKLLESIFDATVSDRVLMDFMANSIRLVVTRGDGLLTRNNVLFSCNRMIESIAQSMRQQPTNRGFKLLHQLFTSVIANPGNLLVMNFTDPSPQGRHEFLAAVDSIRPFNQRVVHFNQVAPEQATFNQRVLAHIGKVFAQKRREFSTVLPQQIAAKNATRQAKQEAISRSNQQLTNHRSRIAACQSEIANPRDGLSALETTRDDKQQRVNTLTNAINQAEAVKVQQQQAIQSLLVQINQLNSDETSVVQSTFTREFPGHGRIDDLLRRDFTYPVTSWITTYSTPTEGKQGFALEQINGKTAWTRATAVRHHIALTATMPVYTQQRYLNQGTVQQLNTQIASHQAEITRQDGVIAQNKPLLAAAEQELRASGAAVDQARGARTARQQQLREEIVNLQRDVQALTNAIAQDQTAVTTLAREVEQLETTKAGVRLELIENQGLFNTVRAAMNMLGLAVNPQEIFWDRFDDFYRQDLGQERVQAPQGRYSFYQQAAAPRGVAASGVANAPMRP